MHGVKDFCGEVGTDLCQREWAATPLMTMRLNNEAVMNGVPAVESYVGLSVLRVLNGG